MVGKNTLRRGQLGYIHDMCVKYTPPKCVAFNFGFHFWCLGFIIMVHTIEEFFFIVLHCIRFWFKLINQIIFEMELNKWFIVHFLSSSIWKWLIVKILFYHILMVIAFGKTHLWHDNYQILLMAHKCILIIWNHDV